MRLTGSHVKLGILEVGEAEVGLKLVFGVAVVVVVMCCKLNAPNSCSSLKMHKINKM